MRASDADGTPTGEDDGSWPPAHSFCSTWWRATAEFSLAGLYPAEAQQVSSLPPRARLLKEMERLAMVATAHESCLDDLRHRLVTYRSGDLWVPSGGFSKEETDVPAVATVLLVGFVGAGKSSLVNLMYSVLGRSGLIPFAQTSPTNGNAGRTRRLDLEEHNVLRSPRAGFCVFDTVGLDYDKVGQGLEEVEGWMSDGVRHHQPCEGSGESEAGGPRPVMTRRFVTRRVNCAVVVVSLSEAHRELKLMDGERKRLAATKELFRAPCLRVGNEDPLVIMTHGDELAPEDRISARLGLCEHLGVVETTGAYDIACLNEHGLLVDEFDPVTACALSEALYRALLVSDRNHPLKRRPRDAVVFALSWLACSLSAFFAFLSCCLSRLAKRTGKIKLP